jgi:hypothetical protein
MTNKNMSFMWTGGQRVTLRFGDLVHEERVTLNPRRRKR